MDFLATPLLCLALNGYKEARGEPEVGELAVAVVVLNRAAKQKKPVCEVILQRKQFSWTITDIQRGRLRRNAEPDITSAAWARSVRVAQSALSFQGKLPAATHFHTLEVRPSWAQKFAFVGQYGTHRFYKEL